MAPNVHRPVLTTFQAACLSALRDGKDSKTSIAIQARLDLRKTTASLRKLEELGLARRGEMKTWLMTMRGKKCRFRTVPETMRRGDKSLGPGLRRLLDAMDRPMRGRELAKKMGVTIQNVGARDPRLPLSAGHVEVEQDRAPAVLPHPAELAQPAAHRSPRRGRVDRRDDDQNRPESREHTRHAQLSEGHQGQQSRNETPRHCRRSVPS
jgi:hypothetical protein